MAMTSRRDNASGRVPLRVPTVADGVARPAGHVAGWALPPTLLAASAMGAPGGASRAGDWALFSFPPPPPGLVVGP